MKIALNPTLLLSKQEALRMQQPPSGDVSHKNALTKFAVVFLVMLLMCSTIIPELRLFIQLM